MQLRPQKSTVMIQVLGDFKDADPIVTGSQAGPKKTFLTNHYTIRLSHRPKHKFDISKLHCGMF